MSLLWKNELRLRVGPRHSEASIWRAGVQTRCAGRARVAGHHQAAVEEVLGVLVAEGHVLPDAASMCVDDEYLYYTTLPAGGSWDDAQAAAVDYFAEKVGEQNLLVETSLAPCGRSWVAVAIDAALVVGWRETLAVLDVRLGQVRAALFEDLWTLRDDMSLDDGVAVVIRSEGAMLVGLHAGCITDLAWERCNVADPEAIAARVQGYSARLSEQLGIAGTPGELPVFVVPADAAQHALIRPLASSLGWRLGAALFESETSVSA
ncbi:MAG: hypothetical protein ABL916_24080 [Burkholderiaceae bacterium]